MKLMRNFLTPPAQGADVPANKVDSKYKELRWQVFIGIFIGYDGY